MTTNTIAPPVEYIEDGSTLTHSIPFRFLLDTDLVITRTVNDTVTTLVLGVDYSATGAGEDAGGELVKTSGGTVGATLRIDRFTAREQSMDYTPNDTFPAESHERALDRLTLIAQEQDGEIVAAEARLVAAREKYAARTFMVPEGELAPSVPSLASHGGKFLGIGAGGTSLVPLSGAGGGDAALRTDLAGENGADLIGGITDAKIPYPVNVSKILLDIQVSRMLSGAGDGSPDLGDIAEETAKFQAVIDQGRSFSVPEPADTYRVNQLNLANGQMIVGSGMFSEGMDKFQFTGNGIASVFKLGDGTGNKRRMTLRDLSVYNNGAGCIDIEHAPNCLIQSVRARCEGLADPGATLFATYSWRFAVRDSNIDCSGGGTAIDLLDNMNGATIENVTMTGGSAGRAMRVGRSQGLRIVANITEVSKHGFHIAATSHALDGNCNGVLLAENYFEQVGTPLILGKVFSLYALECVANFLSNTSAEFLSYREAMIQFGRIRGGVIENNTLYPVDAVLYPEADPEDLYWIWLEHASGGFNGLTVDRNEVVGSPTASHQFQGAWKDNLSVRATVGAACNFGFMGGTTRLGSDEPREWISPVINAATGTDGNIIAWLPKDLIKMGGKVVSAEIVDHDGGTHAGVLIQVGRLLDDGVTGSFNETVAAVDMSTLTFVFGRAALPLGIANIFNTYHGIYRITGAGGQTANFRLRLRYRAN